MKKAFATAVVFFALTGCSTTSEWDAVAFLRQDAIDASVYELLAAPERYDGRPVRVIGVVRFSFDYESRSGVYATTDDYRHRTDGVIDIGSIEPIIATDERSLSRMNGTYAVIEGVFRAKPPIPLPAKDGSIAVCAGKCWGGGTIERVSRVSSWQF